MSAAERCARYQKKYPEKVNAKSRAWRDKKRAEVLKFLGGKCVVCGFDDPRALQIDHIHGGGLKEMREIPNPLKRQKLVFEQPERYQLLCANHNWIKRHGNNETGRKCQ